MTLLAIADGPPCLEAIHAWTSNLGTTAPLINEPSVADVPLDESDVPRSPNRIVLDEAVGFYSLADADNNRIPRTAQPGELVLPSERLGKTIVYQMHIEATTGQALRALSAQLRGAFRDRNGEGRMVLTPGEAWGTIPWAYAARVIELEIDDTVEDYTEGSQVPWRQDVTLTLQMSDPRFYAWEDAGTAEEITGASAATVVATNDGNDDTDPYFTITVASPGDVTVENLSVTTSSGTAALALIDVPAGELVIDFRARSIRLDGDLAHGLLDTATSDWWDELIPGLKPGANNIKVTGGAWAMTFRHAST